VRLSTKETRMKDKKQWLYRWKNWLMPSAVPGVWKRKEGGHFVRTRVVDPTTGRMKEIKKVMPEADVATAFKWLQEERARVQAGIGWVPPPQHRFGDYANSLFERKMNTGEVRSAKGREKWRHVLEHLIGGTEGKKSGLFVPGFGEFFIDKLDVPHVESWREGMGTLIGAGDYAPTTVNGWLAVLRVILKAARRELRLAHLATEDVKNFDTSECETYSEEEPNTLLPEEVPVFLDTMRRLYPQHYAMVYVGLITGLRPSSLRPLRRAGAEADVLWDKNRLLVRRSQTLGDEVMRTTKQKKRYGIDLPKEAMDVLQWHVDTQLTTPEQRDSELLFPAVSGGFRSPSVLNKPFADVAQEMGLGKRFTQRGLRRTFNDLARAARVDALVTRSISGHLTERMQDHYSTVNADEQRQGIAKVIELTRARAKRQAEASEADGVSGGAPGGAPGAAGGAL
jgi:integrase